MKDAVTRVARSTRRGAGIALSPRGLKGAGVEILWTAAHVAAYPFGVAQERRRPEQDMFTLTGLPPVQRGLVTGDVGAAGTPILLVHGVIDNRTIFARLRRQLRRRGFGRIYTLNYTPLLTDVRTAAAQLAERVEQVCSETGYERIHVVGHSLGGIIARYYVQILDGDARVHTVVTLGSPHAGTALARALPAMVIRQLRPGSPLLTELAAPVESCRTRFLSVWSDLDHLVVPQRSARLDHPDLMVRNLLVRGVGHMSLPIHGRVLHEISATLAHLDSDGSTVTAGVTALHSRVPGPPVAADAAADATLDDLAGAAPGRRLAARLPRRRAAGTGA